jgi:ATP-binding cassette subfamily B protein
MQKSLDNLNSIVRENLTNVRVVKSFVRQDFEKEKFRHSNDNLTNTSLNAMNLVIFNMPILMFIMNAAIVSVVWFGGNQIINNELDVASMTAFISYIIQILISLMMFSMMFVMLSRAVASYNRVKEVLNTEIDLKDRKNAVKADKFKGDVSFKNVCFKYDKTHDKYILKDINFSVKSGSLTAIIGSTGSGKTSLVQLIPRLYEPSKGKILIDNKDIQKFTLNSLRQNIGVVLQKNTLFSGTIRDNLRWGDIGATDEEIVETAKYVQAHDFITNLPNGYDTWVEQGGVNLSGGQKQRLCIARAILKKPSILILDDSTSAIDTATEAKILDAFKSKLKGVTTFIIAQRISSIISADKIILLDDGKIIATGNHAELLKTCPEYQEIYYSQNSSSEKEAVLND